MTAVCSVACPNLPSPSPGGTVYRLPSATILAFRFSSDGQGPTKTGGSHPPPASCFNHFWPEPGYNG